MERRKPRLARLSSVYSYYELYNRRFFVYDFKSERYTLTIDGGDGEWCILLYSHSDGVTRNTPTGIIHQPGDVVLVATGDAAIALYRRICRMGCRRFQSVYNLYTSRYGTDTMSTLGEVEAFSALGGAV